MALTGALANRDHETNQTVDQKICDFFESIGLNIYGSAEHGNARLPIDADDPHASIKTPIFTVRPFDWSDSEDPRAEINLEYHGTAGQGPFALEWYKYLGRGMLSTRPICEDELDEIFADCKTSLGNFNPGCRNFPYRGVITLIIYGPKWRRGKQSAMSRLITIKTDNIESQFISFEEKDFENLKVADDIVFFKIEPKKESHLPRLGSNEIYNGKNHGAS